MIQIDYRDGRPIYEQVADGIERLALQGGLPVDSQLPSVRQLATELSINPNTIQRAYGELEQRGVIYAAKGRGNFISGDFTELRQRKLSEIGQQITILAKEAREYGATDALICGWVMVKGETTK